MAKSRIPRTALPQRPPSDLEIARTIYALEIRRRNLQIKRQVALTKLERIENELEEVESRLRKLDALHDAPADPPIASDHASTGSSDDDLPSFLLSY